MPARDDGADEPDQRDGADPDAWRAMPA